METFKKEISRLVMMYLMVMIFISSNAQTLNPGHIQQEISERRAKVKQIYSSQIGVREKQPNSGPAVEKYLAYVNLPKGNPWCAAFVCWVYGRAGVGNPRSGWSPDLFGEGRVIWKKGERGKVKKEYQVSSIRYQDTRKSKHMCLTITGTLSAQPGIWHLATAQKSQ